ncbi:MAG: hypothetical protein ACTSYA_13340 [Candidatus Kariarchaeaceae archaeon]
MSENDTIYEEDEEDYQGKELLVTGKLGINLTSSSILVAISLIIILFSKVFGIIILVVVLLFILRELANTRLQVHFYEGGIKFVRRNILTKSYLFYYDEITKIHYDDRKVPERVTNNYLLVEVTRTKLIQRDIELFIEVDQYSTYVFYFIEYSKNQKKQKWLLDRVLALNRSTSRGSRIVAG